MTDHREPVGSVAEEAAKLFEALRTWTSESADAAGPDPERTETAGGPSAEGGAPCGECRVCPVCRGIALFRAVSPEVKTHLAHAASAFVQGIAEAMESGLPDDYSPRRSGAADTRASQEG